MQTIDVHGATIPVLGFGVFRMSDAEVERIVPAAVQAGFRHFDTAQIYRNEAALGRALTSSGVDREQIFLTTKVWPEEYRSGRFEASVDESLEKLGVDYVDLLLLHWPGGNVPIASQVDLLNKVQHAGKARFIGVSNQNISQFRESVATSTAPIVTNQVEVHPYLDQRPIISAVRDSGAAITAYYGMADGKVPRDQGLAEIGAKYGKSAAQVGLRWLIQQGFVTLTKTANEGRLAENIDVFDFDLDGTDMQTIAGLAQPDGRLISPSGLAPAWDS